MQSPAPPPWGTPRAGHHYSRVLAAESRCLARELRAFGPLPREALARRCRASRWREGGFQAALAYGVSRGTLRELPGGFVAAARSTIGHTELPS